MSIYDFHYDKYYSYNVEDADLTKISLTVPISFGCMLNVGHNVFIMPYTGLHLTGNIVGKLEAEVNGYSREFDMFDEDDVNEDGRWSRWQYGWQIGATATFDNVSLGVEYSLDFNKLIKKCKTSDLFVTVGYNF